MSFSVDTSWSDRRLAAAVAEVVAVPKIGAGRLLRAARPARAARPHRARCRTSRPISAWRRGAAGSRSSRPSTRRPASRSPDGPPLDARPLDELVAALRLPRSRPAISTTSTISPLRSVPVRRRRADAARARRPGGRVARRGRPTRASCCTCSRASRPTGRSPARSCAGRHASSPRYPELQLHWFEDPDDQVVGGSLADALLDVPMLGVPGSDFIFPIMHQAEESGLATKLLSAFVDRARRCPIACARELSRIAAWSMLQEPPDSRALRLESLPDDAAGGDGHRRRRRRRARATAVAATYVVGFRAVLGQRVLDPDWIPMRCRLHTDLADAAPAVRQPAAAFVWHYAGRRVRPAIVADLAGFASAHHDAHLVKYTLAVLRRGRERSFVPPSLPRGRRLAFRLVGPTSRARIRLLTEARVPRVGARGRGASGDGPRSRRRSPAGSPTPGHRHAGDARRGRSRRAWRDAPAKSVNASPDAIAGSVRVSIR